MPVIPQEIIEEIRAKCDIVEVIGAFVQLKRAGSSSFKGLCPFHQEKTPSFHVDAARQCFHCFGCGKGGDVFRFLMEKENLTFPDVLHLLASRAGVLIPEGPASGERRSGAPDKREKLYLVNAKFCEFFRDDLKRHPEGPAAKYLTGRGITPDVAERFQIGSAPDAWTAGLEFGRRCGFTEAEMLEAGVIRRHEESGRCFDQFRGRITFAITNERGQVVGFSARTLEPKPQDGRKYVNTGDTPVFHKGTLLYALALARQCIGQTKQAVLCEGQLDTIAFHRSGVSCAVAPLGTAFTPEQARMLKRYDAKTVILAFDSDGAGQKAVLRAAEILLPFGVELKVMHVPGGKDPDELFRTAGPDALPQEVKAAVSWLDELHRMLPALFDLATLSGRGQAATYLAGYLRLIPNPVELELCIGASAKFLGVSEAAVAAEVERSRAAQLKQQAFRAENRQAAARPKSSAERSQLLAVLLLAVNSQEAARMLAEELTPEELPESDPVCHAINVVLGAALNDEFDSAPRQIANELMEHPDPEIGRALMEHPDYSGKAAAAVQETLQLLRRVRRRNRQQQLLAELRAAADPERRQTILQEIEALSKENR